MEPDDLLLDRAAVSSALGDRARLDPDRDPSAPPAHRLGSLVSAAALKSAYRTFSGFAQVDEAPTPLAVSEMALLFGSPERSANMFAQIAHAAHLRTTVAGIDVAVETVTSPAGLASYWGFLQRGDGLIILTLDTMSPEEISLSDFRLLVAAAADRMDRQFGESPS
ncbi:MAG TPA: hypothetical protein VKX16_12565 [Chloroflexota bacterium]|nr:hypothetical protein [Chloroflexota bacterium]